MSKLERLAKELRKEINNAAIKDIPINERGCWFESESLGAFIKLLDGLLEAFCYKRNREKKQQNKKP
ncbi:MAG: hypothetical protein ACYTEO_17290 [Planctomycetota bacterium]|jgi:hypothetical protein